MIKQRKIREKLEQNRENKGQISAVIFLGLNGRERFYQQFNNSIWDARIIMLNITFFKMKPEKP